MDRNTASRIADKYITKEGGVPEKLFKQVRSLFGKINLEESIHLDVFKNGLSPEAITFLSSQEGQELIEEQTIATNQLLSLGDRFQDLTQDERQMIIDLINDDKGFVTLAHLTFSEHQSKVSSKVWDLRNKQIEILMKLKSMNQV